MHESAIQAALALRAGELVEVRSREEILSTLDQNGCLENLPFMPEMFPYCGRKFRVAKRAHKTCDTINYSGGRRLEHSVHLEDVRCSGQAHGGCQAECLIFWKESWLRRVQAIPIANVNSAPPAAPGAVNGVPAVQGCSESNVQSHACARSGDAVSDAVYSCQATRLLAATTALPWWNLRQYWEDYVSGNVGPGRMLRVFSYSGYDKLRRLPWLGKWFKKLYNLRQRLRGKPRHPRTAGRVAPGAVTPTADLNLQAGERVRVKDFEAILDTIDGSYTNRGMKWDAEMVPYCGGVYQVRRRVERIVDERTGKMRILKNPCLILEGVVCQARYSECRLFCPRSIYPYWREVWLERVVPASSSDASASSGPHGKSNS
jgi:hypothetical protein